MKIYITCDIESLKKILKKSVKYLRKVPKNF